MQNKIFKKKIFILSLILPTLVSTNMVFLSGCNEPNTEKTITCATKNTPEFYFGEIDTPYVVDISYANLTPTQDPSVVIDTPESEWSVSVYRYYKSSAAIDEIFDFKFSEDYSKLSICYVTQLNFTAIGADFKLKAHLEYVVEEQEISSNVFEIPLVFSIYKPTGFTEFTEESKQYLSFLDDRTFSSVVETPNPNKEMPNAKTVYTGWILGKYKDASGEFDTEDSYHYFVVFNLRAAKAMKDASEVYFAKTSSFTEQNSHRLKSDNEDWNFKNQMNIDEYFDYHAFKEEWTGKPGGSDAYLVPDIAFVSVSFSDYLTDGEPNAQKTALKTQLDRVNEYCETEGGENKMSVKIAESHIENKEDIYMVGYQGEAYLSAEQKNMRHSKIYDLGEDAGDYLKYNATYPTTLNPIMEDAENTWYYASGYFNRTGFQQGMTFGSSGSLLINKNYEAVGIIFYIHPSDVIFGISYILNLANEVEEEEQYSYNILKHFYEHITVE